MNFHNKIKSRYGVDRQIYHVQGDIYLISGQSNYGRFAFASQEKIENPRNRYEMADFEGGPFIPKGIEASAIGILDRPDMVVGNIWATELTNADDNSNNPTVISILVELKKK